MGWATNLDVFFFCLMGVSLYTIVMIICICIKNSSQSEWFKIIFITSNGLFRSEIQKCMSSWGCSLMLVGAAVFWKLVWGSQIHFPTVLISKLLSWLLSILAALISSGHGNWLAADRTMQETGKETARPLATP